VSYELVNTDKSNCTEESESATETEDVKKRRKKREEEQRELDELVRYVSYQLFFVLVVSSSLGLGTVLFPLARGQNRRT